MKTKKILALLLVSVMIASSFSAISAVSDSKLVIFNNPTDHTVTIKFMNDGVELKSIDLNAGERITQSVDNDMARSFTFITADGSTKTVDYDNVDINPDSTEPDSSYGPDASSYIPEISVWNAY
jgi:hypothetical protein